MSLRKARAAVGATPEVEAAAEELLGKGNAIDAVVAAVFAAAAISPGVLLGPVQILVGGAGAGMLAIDGRVRQPGIGAPRPRGFQANEEVPDASRVGVPWLPAALSVANATMGSATFNQVLSPAIALAKGSPRAAVLQRIAARGPRALDESLIGGELLAAFGRPSQGLLTNDDLVSPRPDVQKAVRVGARGSDDPVAVTALPWAHLESGLPAAPAHDLDISRARAVAAVDRNATFALACWEDSTDGLLVEPLGLRAPFFAEPVRRGETRVKPGDVRPAAAPIALVGPVASPEIAFAAFGSPDAYAVLTQALEAFLTDRRIEAHGESRLLALAHANKTASVLRS